MAFAFAGNNLESLQEFCTLKGVEFKNRPELEVFNDFWKLTMTMMETEIEKAFDIIYSKLGPNNTTDRSKAETLKRFRAKVGDITWDENQRELGDTDFLRNFFAECIEPKDFGCEFVSWRNIFEITKPIPQCLAAGKINKTLDWNMCYICGDQIRDNKNENFPDAIYGISTRQCEHIIPAFMALGFEGLLTENNQAYINSLTERQKKFFTYEYANSHRCCNQIKGQDKWITYSNGNYVIDNTALNNTLTNIKNWRNLKGQHDCPYVFESKSIDIPQRTNYIISEFLNPLIEIINVTKNEWNNLHYLYFRIKQIRGITAKFPVGTISETMVTAQRFGGSSNNVVKKYFMLGGANKNEIQSEIVNLALNFGYSNELQKNHIDPCRFGFGNSDKVASLARTELKPGVAQGFGYGAYTQPRQPAKGFGFGASENSYDQPIQVPRGYGFGNPESAKPHEPEIELINLSNSFSLKQIMGIKIKDCIFVIDDKNQVVRDIHDSSVTIPISRFQDGIRDNSGKIYKLQSGGRKKNIFKKMNKKTKKNKNMYRKKSIKYKK